MNRKLIVLLQSMIILICALSCGEKKDQIDENFINLSEGNLERVISDFQSKYLFNGNAVDGVAGVKVNDICENVIVEIWKINHTMMFKEKKPWKYTYVNDLPVFIYNEQSNLFGGVGMKIEQIQNLIKYHGVVEMNKPPRTEYTSRVLYRIKDLSHNTFNIVDTLTKYNDPEIVDEKIGRFIEKIKCY